MDDSSKEEVIFAAALAIEDSDSRALYLDEACAGDTQLRHSVQRLLDCDDTSEEFLNTPVIEHLKVRLDQRPGDVVERYKLLEHIGEGGFGAVWRAEQQEPVQRQVALKIIKMGMVSHQMMGRFEVERQALAMMNHANIATVFDAGTTEQGRPFFAMEFVQGQDIDRYCDENRLTVRQRLQLFADICLAMHHAHQKGIVHRDLKPSNILVTTIDGRPTPKIIDFGIAKAIGTSNELDAAGEAGSQSLACDADEPLVASQVVGTPGYISPEQMGSEGDVDTRADVYALGAVLYKLLLGVTPFTWDSLRGKSLEEYRKTIQRIRPPDLTARINDLNDPVATAATRCVTPAELRMQLRGDLTWITCKALESDRQLRYGSAIDLARDIESHLACYPVSAAPATTKYKLGRLFRRNRVAVIAGLVVLVSLLGGIVVAGIGLVNATKQWHRAEAERRNAVQERAAAEKSEKRAIEEAKKTLQFAQMLEDLIGTVGPDQGLPADVTKLGQLDTFAGALAEQELGEYPLIEARIQRTFGRVYMTFREYAKAGPHLQRALHLRQEHLQHNKQLVRQSQVDLAWYLVCARRLAAAEELLQEALPELHQSEPSDELILGLEMLSRIRNVQRRRPEADELVHSAWKIAESLHGEDHPLTVKYQARAAMSNLQPRHTDNAERLARDALQRMLAVRPSRHPDVALVQFDLARVLFRMRQYEESEQLVWNAMDIHREMLGEDSVFVLADMVLLVRILRQDDARSDEMLALASEAADLADSCIGEGDISRIAAYQLLSDLLRDDSPGEAAILNDKAITLRRGLVRYDKWIYNDLRKLGFLYRQLGNIENAERCYRDLIALLQSERKKAPWQEIWAYHELADLLRESGDLKEAEHFLRAAVSVDTTGDNPRSAAAQSMVQIDYVETLLTLGRVEEAKQISAALESLESDRARAAALVTKAQIESATGDLASAKEILSQATDKYRNRLKSARLISRINGLLAEYQIRSGDFEAAESLLLRTQRRAWRGAHTRAIVVLLDIDRRRIANQLVALYAAWDKPDQVKRWRELLSP